MNLPTILILVNIRSAHNVGALFRTADGLGASLLLVGITPRPHGGESEDRLPHITQKAHVAIHKTALGAEESVEWEYTPTISEAVEIVRSKGYHIGAIEQDPSSLRITELPTNRPVALLLGPEVEGLPSRVLSLLDAIYEIPMIGSKESYNVSIAGAIGLYQAQRNRNII